MSTVTIICLPAIFTAMPGGARSRCANKPISRHSRSAFEDAAIVMRTSPLMPLRRPVLAAPRRGGHARAHRRRDGVRGRNAGRDPAPRRAAALARERSEEHTSELQSLMRISYAVFCLKKKKKNRAGNH